MVVYRSLLGLAALTAAVFVYFFLLGIADGTVSAANIGSWTLVLSVLGAVLAGGVVLQRRGRPGWSKLVLAVVAVPTALGGLVALFMLLTVERWN